MGRNRFIGIVVVICTAIIIIFYLSGCGTTGYRAVPSGNDEADIDQLLGIGKEGEETIAEDDVLKLLGVAEENEASTSRSKTAGDSEKGISQYESSQSSSETKGRGEGESVSSTDQKGYSSQKSSAMDKTSPVWKTSSFYDQYQEALQAYRSKNFRGAVQKFEALLAINSKHTLSDNCQYWIGESYYGMGNYQEAILSFEKVFAFASSNKDDAAQLKLGLCYMHINDKVKAKAELQKLINDYPTSEYVSMAKRLIAKIDEGS